MQLFRAHSAETLAKVVPIVGELSAPNFGMPAETYRKLCDAVHIIYHSAATIKFKTHLRTAIATNLTGTLRTVQFAKALRHLDAYVYVSTAFCNSDRRGNILEQVYASVQDPYEMIRLAETDERWTGSQTDVTEMTKELCGGHPNTYTFTKQLAENLIEREMAGMPAGIVRPSVGKCGTIYAIHFENIFANFQIRMFQCTARISIPFRVGWATRAAAISASWPATRRACSAPCPAIRTH